MVNLFIFMFQHRRGNLAAAGGGGGCMEGEVISESGLPASVHDLRESQFCNDIQFVNVYFRIVYTIEQEMGIVL